MTEIQVLLTKITPPKLSGRILVRSRIQRALLESLDYRLTLVQAGAGYGKSTALATIIPNHHPVFWYQVSEEDADPFVFLQYLCHAVQRALPDIQGLPIPAVESWNSLTPTRYPRLIVDQLLNVLSETLREPALLILDDAQLIAHNQDIILILDRLISLAPHALHILVVSRGSIKLPSLYRWKSKGEVRILDQADLAFSKEEIGLLFAQKYGYELTPDEIEALHTTTEGWAITLQLIWQNLRTGAMASIEEALSKQRTSLDGLFEVLAHEVFEQQPDDIRGFLLETAILRSMSPADCDILRDSHDSQAMLAYLRRQELFVVEHADGTLRYHPIFQSFLRSRMQAMYPLDHLRRLHQRLAEYYRQQSEFDGAIYHALQASHFPTAAELLEQYAEQLILSGRPDTLANYLDALPPETFPKHPMLVFYQGELARLRSRFPEALGWYQQAENLWRKQGNTGEVSRSLRGQARVYLDTVNPSKAEELLQQALRLSDGTADREAHSRLYELLAENRLNAGKPDEAEALRTQAEELRTEGPSDSQLYFRVLLRTGRFSELRQQLEQRAEAEVENPPRMPRAHRETRLLLSLLYAFQGEADLALQNAQEGTLRGQQMHSPFVTAVGYMRQGHAQSLTADRFHQDDARDLYNKTIELSRQLAVPRLRVEAHWGLCRLFGFHGDLDQAYGHAHAGLKLAEQAGDEWVASLLCCTMAASLILAARYEMAQSWIQRAVRGFAECSDIFGTTVARLWLALSLHRQNDSEKLASLLPEVLYSCQQNKYAFLFTRGTLLGVPSARMLVPLLITARDHGWQGDYAAELLAELGLPGIISHPGYRLRVFTMGTFEVFQGRELIAPNSWRREKSRQLFQLLVTFKSNPLDREQILEYLWPDQDPTASRRSFKVTLSTLYSALEPDREPGSDSAFILRQGSIYGLRPEADLWIDSQEMKDTLQQAEALHKSNPTAALQLYEQALELYQGEYLPDARYETWAAGEREHLAALYLHAADVLASLYLDQQAYAEVIDRCQRILSQDNCWERAYRYLMQAYHRLGDSGQLARTYQRCVDTLRLELDVDPSIETRALYNRLTGRD
jgi:ATP/maltotriose-dependent transcriptional regulator MalT